jgi:hypothetical protein
MLKRPLILVFALILFAAFSGGCAHFSADIGAFTGYGIKDLENARAEGKTKILLLSYDKAFEIITDILKKNNLKIYQSSKRKRYIVVIGFHKQVDTTRVGIFFDPISRNETKLTLSSLSSTALIKAEEVMFGSLEQ